MFLLNPQNNFNKILSKSDKFNVRCIFYGMMGMASGYSKHFM